MSNENYEVGYGKPPANTQFKKGQSGNPKGRPGGSQNMATIFVKALKEKVSVTQNGKRREMTKLEAAVNQLINKAASGDLKSIQSLLPQVNIIENREKDNLAIESKHSEADQLTMESIKARMQRSAFQELAVILENEGEENDQSI